MKAALVVALATAAFAALPTQYCTIPAKYTMSTAAGACSGPMTGYDVSFFCRSAYDPINVAAALVATPQTFPLNAANAASFTAVGNPNPVAGCIVPSLTADAATNLVTPFVAPTAGCSAYNGVNFGTGAASSSVKGADIRCATGYFPIAGVEGSMFCNSAVAPFALSGVTNAYFQSGFGQVNQNNIARFDDNQLTCARGCTLPTTLCNVNAAGQGVPNSNVILGGASLQANSCNVLPTNAGGNGVVSSVQISCASNPGQVFTATCNGDATTNTNFGSLVFANGAAPNCGPVDGAVTQYIADGLNLPAALAAGTTELFPTVSGTSSILGTAALAQVAGLERVYQPFVSGTSYIVTIIGCATNVNRNECVQTALNTWRCNGLRIDSGTFCYANNVRIACPTAFNGYDCDGSSKKGLLGLLGLLLIIPLCLLCLCCLLCCLLPCCLKRKKTEGDVHFATFDPHAAPVVASCAPVMECAPTMGACAPGAFPTAHAF